MPFGGNPTPHYGFGQYLDTDKTDWADNNITNSKVDTSLFTVETKADTASNLANNAQGTADEANQAAVGAGNKADSAIAQLAGIKTWTSGAFINPNQNKFTAYDMKFKYNPSMGLVQIFGAITANNPKFANTDVFANFSQIPGFILPLNDISVWKGPILYGSNFTTQYISTCKVSTTGALSLNTSQIDANDYYYMRCSFMLVTDGWGSVQ